MPFCRERLVLDLSSSFCASNYYPIRSSVKTVGRTTQLSPQRGPVPSPYWYWTSLSRNSLSTAYNLSAGCSRPSVSPSIFIRPLSPAPRRPPLRYARRPRLVSSSSASGNRRWRRRWGRCAAPEGGRTRPSGASIPKTLGEPCKLWLLTGCVTVFRGDACSHVRSWVVVSLASLLLRLVQILGALHARLLPVACLSHINQPLAGSCFSVSSVSPERPREMLGPGGKRLYP